MTSNVAQLAECLLNTHDALGPIPTLYQLGIGGARLQS